MNTSFVIPALNEEQHLTRCLQSIRDLEKSPLATTIETLVVDNDSTDRTTAIAQSFGCTVLRVTPGQPGVARNAGAARAGGEILAFVDADCELPKLWMARLVEHLQDKSVCAAGGAMARPGESATWVERCWHAMAHRRTLEAREVPWLPSFNLLVRKSAFEAVGGFSEDLVTGEDVDLGYRLSEKGRLLLDGAVEVKHLGESRSIGEFFRREMWRGRGSLQGFQIHGVRLDEIPSIAAPLVFALAITLGIGSLVAGIFIPWFSYLGTVLLVSAGLLPAAIVITRRVGVDLFPGCWVVMTVYLGARALGWGRPFQRVPRAGT